MPDARKPPSVTGYSNRTAKQQGSRLLSQWWRRGRAPSWTARNTATGLLRSADGTITEGPFVDGKTHGRWVSRYPNGDVSEHEYRPATVTMRQSTNAAYKDHNR